jgi:hypothetical protein
MHQSLLYKIAEIFSTAQISPVSQTVENSHSFFNVSTACYKSLSVIKPKGVIKTVWEIAQKVYEAYVI